MFGMGHWEILIILVIILLVFGAKRIPEMAQGLGKGIREFRTAMRDVQDEMDINAPKPDAQGSKIETSAPTDSVAQNAPNHGADGENSAEQRAEKQA